MSAPAVPVPRHLVPLLAAFTSLVVLTTDVYLPVLPQLGTELGTTSAAAAATVSAVLVGIAVGQVVVGPLSDAVGRRVPLLVGGLAYAVAHLLSALAPSIGVLLGLRVLAGLATAACLVVTRAVVADAYPGAAAARAFATLSAVTAIAPVVAPVAGGLLAHVMTWRGMFVVLAGAAVLLTAISWRALPETLPAERRVPPHLGSVVAGLGSVLRIRTFLAYLAATAAFGGILFGYIGASSFVLQGSFGLSPQQYSLVFALNAVGIFVASNLSRHLVGRAGSARLLASGHLTSGAGAVVLGVGVGLHSLPLVMAGLFLAVASLGLVIPAATTLGMAAAPGRAGAASGVLGICQFTVGAIASPLAGAGGSPWSLVVVVAVCAAAGPVLLHVLRRPAPEPTAPHPSDTRSTT
ncbi:Bcr/CflA family efflux MFS transporter [Cellulomonas sp. ICMP 17802]|uniref:Bcr/CflA family efflux MFS transporter n=1 Tax=Cellulomonas sp. ICMP 17802 TaxID=3239199 RepID=UPI00351B048E